MNKKVIHVPKGTFIDVGSLEKGEPASMTTPNGKIIKTSPVEHYYVSAKQVYIETQNSFYTTL